MSRSVEGGHDVTRLLKAWGGGNQAALDALIPLVHAELHRVAQAHLRRERPDHSLQATALVNEAYLRLVDQRRVEWQNRAHFFGTAAQLMRRILVDHARQRRRVKRGGDVTKVVLDSAAGAVHPKTIDVLALDVALERLAELDAPQGEIVTLRFFGGLSIEETAEVLSISAATVKREWASARYWFKRELAAQDA